MSDTLHAKIRAAAEANTDRCVALLQDLVRIKSLSCEEGGVVARIAQGMRDAGWDEVRVDRLGNVIGRIGTGPRVLAFDAHVDTVDVSDPTPFPYPPFDAVVADGHVWGRGASDMKGGMAAIVGEERAKVAELCKEFDIEAANFNAPGQIIVSGDKTKVDAAVAAAKERGWKKVMPLNVAGAYHSRLMEPARAAFAEFLKTVPFAAPKYTVFTNTTGQAISQPDDLRAALVKQVVSSVLWEDCMRSASAAGATEYWELGVGGVLAGLVRRIDKSWPAKSYSEFADLSA